jgi:hypothetical protein
MYIFLFVDHALAALYAVKKKENDYIALTKILLNMTTLVSHTLAHVLFTFIFLFQGFKHSNYI